MDTQTTPQTMIDDLILWIPLTFNRSKFGETSIKVHLGDGVYINDGGEKLTLSTHEATIFLDSNVIAALLNYLGQAPVGEQLPSRDEMASLPSNHGTLWTPYRDRDQYWIGVFQEMARKADVATQGQDKAIPGLLCAADEIKLRTSRERDS